MEKVFLIFALCFMTMQSDFAMSPSYEKKYFMSSYAEALDVISTKDSGFLIVGFTTGNGWHTDSSHVYVVKTNSKGDTLWTITVQTNVGDEIFKASEYSGGFILVGRKTYNHTLGFTRVLLLNISNNGLVLQEKTWSIGANSQGETCVATTGGGFLIGCDYMAHTNPVYRRRALIKLNSAFDSIGYTQYSVHNEDSFGGTLVPVESNNFVYISNIKDSLHIGDTSGLVISKISEQGSLLWRKRIDSLHADWPTAIHLMPDGNYLVCATYDVYADYPMAYIAKMDTAGKLLWDNTFVGEFGNYVSDMAIADNTHFLITGYASGQGYTFSYLTKINFQGQVDWTEYFIDTASTNPNGWPYNIETKRVIVAKNGQYAMTGFASNNYGPHDFLILMDSTATPSGIEQTKYIASNISIYPNPFKTDVTIEVKEAISSESDFVLYNITGQILQRIILHVGENYIQAGNLPIGVYLFKIQGTNGSIQTGKLIKQ